MCYQIHHGASSRLKRARHYQLSEVSSCTPTPVATPMPTPPRDVHTPATSPDLDGDMEVDELVNSWVPPLHVIPTRASLALCAETIQALVKGKKVLTPEVCLMKFTDSLTNLT